MRPESFPADDLRLFKNEFMRLHDKQQIARTHKFLIQKVDNLMARCGFEPGSVEDVVRFANDLLSMMELNPQEIIAFNSVVGNLVFKCSILCSDYQKDQPRLSNSRNFIEHLGRHFNRSEFNECFFWAATLGMDKAITKMMSVRDIQTSTLNNSGYAPIHAALLRRHLMVVNALIDGWRGVSNEMLKRALKVKDKDGKTAIHHAAKMGFVDMVKLLISNGATEDMIEGADKLYLQIAEQDEDAQKFLQELGDDRMLEKMASEGTTVAHLQAYQGNCDPMLKLALDDIDEGRPFGQSLEIKDADNFSVLERFIESGEQHQLVKFCYNLGNNEKIEARQGLPNVILTALNDIPDKFLPSDSCLEFIREYFSENEQIVSKVTEVQNLKDNAEWLQTHFNNRLQNLIQQAGTLSSAQEVIIFVKRCKSLCDQLNLCDSEDDSRDMVQISTDATAAMQQFKTSLQASQMSEEEKEFFTKRFDSMIEILKLIVKPDPSADIESCSDVSSLTDEEAIMVRN